MDVLRPNRTSPTSGEGGAPPAETPLSHRSLGAADGPPGARRFAAVARSSLAVAALAMTCAGCIITDPPQFNPPKHTRPFLVESTADPNPNLVLAVDSQQILSTQRTLTFSAEVVSQDDPSSTSTPTDFQQVRGRLYIDYGLEGSQPFVFSFGSTNRLDPGGTIEETGRRISASWSPGDHQDVSLGCHTVTLIVSHIFDEGGCPVCDDDFSTLTWQILRCDMNVDHCQDLIVSGAGSCEGLTNSCVAVREMEGSNAEACPEQAGATP